MPGRPGRRAGADQRRWGWSRAPFFERVGVERIDPQARQPLRLHLVRQARRERAGALALLQRLADNDVDRPVGGVIYAVSQPARRIEIDLTSRAGAGTASG
jgi:hypothetical protein